MDAAIPSREDFDRLLTFLPLLYSKREEPLWKTQSGAVQEEGARRFPWIEYGPVVLAFFMEAGRPVWADYSYDGERARAKLEDPEAVRGADLAQVREMLTFCARGERFADGFWAAVVEEGKVRRLLERIAVLKDELYSDPPQVVP